MIQNEFNEENKEITRRAYELYKKHGFRDGNDFIDWLKAERTEEKLEKKQADKKYKRKHNKEIRNEKKHNKQMRNFLFAIVVILCVIVVILLGMLGVLLKKSPAMNLSEKSLSDSDLKVMMLVLDPKPDEEVVAFGDTYFDYNDFALTNKAKTKLDKDVAVLKENPEMKVRMAGYTSAAGTKESNQELSEKRANEVRNYLIEKGIAQERITVIGYGRTKPALYEVSPDDIDTKEARANMRVLFEVVVE